MVEFEKTANFECYSGELFPNNSIQKFGYDFEAKRNVTFSWSLADSANSITNYFCSPWYFVMKEYVRRTQFNAIPVYVENEARLTIPGYEDSAIPHMLYMKDKRLDIYLDTETVTDMLTSFTKTSIAAFKHKTLINLLGEKYSSNEIDSYFSIFHIFDLLIWFLIFTETFVTCLILTIEILKTNKNKTFWSAFCREWWTINEIICLRHLKIKKWTPVLRIIYSSFLIVSMILLYCLSSLILSQTIHSPYTLIESLEDILNRHDLNPLLILTEKEIDLIQKRGSDIELQILLKSKENGNVRPEIGAELVTLSINAHHIKSELSTHVVISDSYNLHLLKGNDPNLHIASNHYFSVPQSMVFHKDLSQSVVGPLENIMYHLEETGLYHKWISVALEYGWKMSSDPDIQANQFCDKKQQNFTLSNSKIAIGPLVCGIFFSVFILNGELIYHNHHRPKSNSGKSEFCVLSDMKITTFKEKSCTKSQI